MRIAYPSYLLLAGLLTAGCHSPTPPAAIQEAVGAYLRQHGTAGYQPLRWGPVRHWRQVDADSLTILRHRDHEDSLRAWWQRTYAERGAALSRRYKDSAYRVQDSLNLDAIRLNTVAMAYDTTRLGTQVAHTWQWRAATGQLVRDSARFLVPRHGPVVRLPRLRPLY